MRIREIGRRIGAGLLAAFLVSSPVAANETAFSSDEKVSVESEESVETGNVESATKKLIMEIDELEPNSEYEYVVVEDDVVFEPQTGTTDENGTMLAEVEPFDEWLVVFVDDGVWTAGISKEAVAEKFHLSYDEETGKYSFPTVEEESEDETEAYETEASNFDETEAEAGETAVEATEAETEGTSSKETEAETESETEEISYFEFDDEIRGMVVVDETVMTDVETGEVVATLHDGDEMTVFGRYSDETLRAYADGVSGKVSANDVAPIVASVVVGEDGEVVYEPEGTTEANDETEADVENVEETEVEDETETNVENVEKTEVENETEADVENVEETEVEDETETDVENVEETETEDETEADVENVEETETETETETEPPKFEYDLDGMDVSTDGLVVNPSDASYHGEMRISFESKNLGDVEASSATTTLRVEFPKGTILPENPEIDESGTSLSADGATFVALSTGFEQGTVASATTDENVLTLEIADESAESTKKELLVYGDSIKAERGEERYAIDADDPTRTPTDESRLMKFDSLEEAQKYLDETVSTKDSESGSEDGETFDGSNERETFGEGDSTESEEGFRIAVMGELKMDVDGTGDVSVKATTSFLNPESGETDEEEVETSAELRVLRSTLISYPGADAYDFDIPNPNVNTRNALKQTVEESDFDAADFGVLNLDADNGIGRTKSVSGGTTVYVNDDGRIVCGRLLPKDGSVTVVYRDAALIMHDNQYKKFDVRVTYKSDPKVDVRFIIGKIDPETLGADSDVDGVVNSHMKMYYVRSTTSSSNYKDHVWYTSYDNAVDEDKPKKAVCDHTDSNFDEYCFFTMEILPNSTYGEVPPDAYWMMFCGDLDKGEYIDYRGAKGALKGSTSVELTKNGSNYRLTGKVSTDGAGKYPVNQCGWIFFKGDDISGVYGAYHNAGRWGSYFTSTMTSIYYQLTSDSVEPTHSCGLSKSSKTYVGRSASGSRHTFASNVPKLPNGYTKSNWQSGSTVYSGTRSEILYNTEKTFKVKLSLDVGSATITKSVTNQTSRHSSLSGFKIKLVPNELTSDWSDGTRNLPKNYVWPTLEKTTDANGKVTFTDLPCGTYKVQEVNPASYWDPISQNSTITVTKNGTATMTFSNRYKRGNLLVTKTVTDLSGFHNVRNTTFSINLKGTSDGGDPVDMTLSTRNSAGTAGRQESYDDGAEADYSSAGTCLFKNVPIGTYVLTESYPAYGSTMTNVWHVTSPSSGEPSTTLTVPYTGANATGSVSQTFGYANRYKTGKIVLTKNFDYNGATASTTLKPTDIPKNGFKFRLFGTSEGGDVLRSDVDGNGTITYVKTTDSNGQVTFEHVPVGTHYHLVEELTGAQSAAWDMVNGHLTEVDVTYDDLP